MISHSNFIKNRSSKFARESVLQETTGDKNAHIAFRSDRHRRASVEMERLGGRNERAAQS
jgi:hypothetical protein